MNARLFPNNWRPILQEIEFAPRAGFQALQLPGPPTGLTESQLGAPLGEVAAAMSGAGLTAVMEIALPVTSKGRTVGRRTPAEVLEANLPAILGLRVAHVHWHLFPDGPGMDGLGPLKETLPELFEPGLRVAREHGFKFGFEHNAPGAGLLDTPEACRTLLNLSPDLGFVFDLNHAPPDQLEGYRALACRTTLLHISDTPLPEVNWHLPLGQGSIDFGEYLGRLWQGGFGGIGILEIGGQPWSGGYGQDTDAALHTSAKVLQPILAAAGR